MLVYYSEVERAVLASPSINMNDPISGVLRVLDRLGIQVEDDKESDKSKYHIRGATKASIKKMRRRMRFEEEGR